MAINGQEPLRSGFGARTTALEAVAGIDLSGKQAVVTGGHSGIGLETVRALLAAGAEVIVPARSVERAREALSTFGPKVSVAPMDLQDINTVEAFAAEFLRTHDRLDILINNAGIMACPETRVGPGWEAQLATNHFGHFALTRVLLPALREAGGRVVALSSTAHIRGGIRWEDPHFRQGGYDKWDAYAQSKTANALFALELQRQEAPHGVTAFSVHPGGILTPLQRHLEKEEMVAMGWITPDGDIAESAKPFFKTPEQGAATSVWAATSPMLDGRGGQYLENCDIAAVGTPTSHRGEHVRPHAVDAPAARRLWEWTEAELAASGT